MTDQKTNSPIQGDSSPEVMLLKRRRFKKIKFSMSFIQGFTNYISDEGADMLKQYKYAGGDSGILYRYFYNPVALKLVSYLPETLA